jgi:hypothetical protein
MCAVSNSAGVRTSSRTCGVVGESSRFRNSVALMVAVGALMTSNYPDHRRETWVLFMAV